MAVFRIERTKNYTVMSNYHLRDKALSLKSKGLLLSRPSKKAGNTKKKKVKKGRGRRRA